MKRRTFFGTIGAVTAWAMGISPAVEPEIHNIHCTIHPTSEKPFQYWYVDSGGNKRDLSDEQADKIIERLKHK